MSTQDLNRPDLTRFKGRMPQVRATGEKVDDADLAGTEALLNQYTDEDGFHCPRCGVTIANRSDAIAHLAEEINESFRHIGERRSREGGK